ncbi:MAG: ABC transporter ATP-binding protein [Ignavibacteria bacterium]|nr:ABC transporter ATP-binding protein [Ignavibacteria bacterium]
MITLDAITKSYGKFRALDGVSIAFPQGGTTALLGPNGAGKTTALKIMLGLARPDTGTVCWDGHRVNGAHAFRNGIGYMPQIGRFPENLTVAEFLTMIEGLRAAPAARLDAMLERFELSSQSSKRLKDLSGGTRQRVCAVMALMFDVPVYILDEPTSGLDPMMSRRLKDAVRAEKEAGKTVVFTSHIMSDIEELADHVVFLLEGRAVFDGPIEALAGGAGVERAIAALLEARAT